MLKQLQSDLKLHTPRMLGRALFPLIGTVLGLFLVVLIVSLGEESTYLCMGTMMSSLMLIFFGLVWGLYFPQEYMLALSMGCTRKDYLCSFAVRSLFLQMLSYLAVLVGYGLEIAAYHLAFPGIEMANEISMDYLFQWWFLLLAIPGATLIQMFFGTLYGKFGKPFLAVAYFIWIGLCILGPQAIHYEERSGLGSQIIGAAVRWGSIIPGPVWIGLGICAILAMVVSIGKLGKAQMVK